MAAIDRFNEVWALRPAGHRDQTVLRHRRGHPVYREHHPGPRAEATYFDGERLAAGQAVKVRPDTPGAVAHVSCGVVARSLRAVVVNPTPPRNRPTARWANSGCTATTSGGVTGDNPNRPGWLSSATGSATARVKPRRGVAPEADWLRTGDLGMFVDGELYVTGRIVDLMTIEGRTLYPQDVEATVADASPLVRRGYVTAFTAPDLVIVAERAPGTTRSDPQPAIEEIRAAVSHRHGVHPAEVILVPAGAIPRTTSGKLARRACRSAYLAGTLQGKVRQ